MHKHDRYKSEESNKTEDIDAEKYPIHNWGIGYVGVYIFWLFSQVRITEEVSDIWGHFEWVRHPDRFSVGLLRRMKVSGTQDPLRRTTRNLPCNAPNDTTLFWRFLIRHRYRQTSKWRYFRVIPTRTLCWSRYVLSSCHRWPSWYGRHSELGSRGYWSYLGMLLIMRYQWRWFHFCPSG